MLKKDKKTTKINKNIKNVFPFFQKMKQYLIKRGKKHTMEKLLHSFLIRRAEKKKMDFRNILLKAMINSTLVIKLRMRKWGRKIRYKINLIEEEEKEWKDRKALGFFSKFVRNHSEDKFINGFEKELELLYQGKSAVQTKRDDYHRLVLEAMPFFWMRKSKKSKKKLNKKSIKPLKSKNYFIKGNSFVYYSNRKLWLNVEDIQWVNLSAKWSIYLKINQRRKFKRALTI